MINSESKTYSWPNERCLGAMAERNEPSFQNSHSAARDRPGGCIRTAHLTSLLKCQAGLDQPSLGDMEMSSRIRTTKDHFCSCYAQGGEVKMHLCPLSPPLCGCYDLKPPARVLRTLVGCLFSTILPTSRNHPRLPTHTYPTLTRCLPRHFYSGVLHYLMAKGLRAKLTETKK